VGVRARTPPLPRALPALAAHARALAAGPRLAASVLDLSNPYDILGVRPGVSDEELRSTYRRLVQLHHPDHNNGSPESARRFEEVQDAYAAIQRERRRAPTRPPREAPPPPAGSPDVEQRLADMERELREKAKAARERAQRAARAAASAATSSKTDRPSDEDLGYIKTDDSLGKIIADGLDEFAEWIEHRRPKGPRSK
jgi:curved DNA-binding protein CbpA